MPGTGKCRGQRRDCALAQVGLGEGLENPPIDTLNPTDTMPTTTASIEINDIMTAPEHSDGKLKCTPYT